MEKMEITVSKSELLHKLKAVGKIVKPSNVLPEHNNFLFHVMDGILEVTGADSQGNITAWVDCEISSKEAAKFLLDSKITLDGLKELPEQPITFKVEPLNDSFIITVIHQSGTYKLHGLNAEGFSMVENRDEDPPVVIKLESQVLIDGIKKAYRFAANDELRPIMNSVFIESENGNLNFVSTNSSTMAVYSVKNTELDEFNLVLPVKMAKIISDLAASFDEAIFELGSKSVSVQFSGIRISCLFVEGKYLNYRSVIPKHNDKRVNVNTQSIISALKRTLIFSDQQTSLIVLKINGSVLNISGRDEGFDMGANENITAEFDYSDPLEIGFNGNYLLQCLETIETDYCELNLGDASKACLISPFMEKYNYTDLTMLIMPMIINV